MFSLTRNQKNSLVIVAGILLITGFSFKTSPFSVNAQSAVDVSQKKTDLEKKLIELNKKIQGYQGEIQKTRSQQASLSNEIKLYDNQINSTELALEVKETQIEDTNLQISELRSQIEKRLKEISDNKKILSELMVELYQKDNNSLIHLTLGNKTFSEVLDDIKYNENVQSKVYQIVQNIKSVKEKLEAQEKNLKIELSKLESLREQLRVTQGSLEGQRQQKQSLLSKTKGLESNYRKLLTSSQEEEDKIQKEIEDLDAAIREKLGKRTISANKGALAWPMDGTLTQKYGNTGFTKLGYSFHNGIDIAAPAGKSVYAAGSGKVVAADTGEAAYGNWIAIKHSIETKSGKRDIIALYAHLRSFKVKTGDIVEQGDLIGYEGNTGNTTRLLYGPERGYHLHFTIFDTEGFGISQGKSTKVYGRYTVPYGYTYNPLDFF
jgi:murein DD-endopeptidase MepM/ murein hydrolase activator NlpD